MSKDKPVVIIIGTELRRDGAFALPFFLSTDLYWFFTSTPYHDFIVDSEIDTNLIRYSEGNLLWNLRRLDPDVIISGADIWNYRHLPRLVRDFLLAKWLKAKFILFTIENRPLVVRYPELLNNILKPLLQFIARHSTEIWHINEGARRNGIALDIPESRFRKIMFSNWGVDLDEFRPVLLSAKSVEPMILYVGRMIDAKGIADLIMALEYMYPDLPKFKCVFIGSGNWQTKVIDEVTGRPYQRNVQVLGPLPNSEVVEYMQKAWITVTPSRITTRWEEQVGMVNLQSLACGTPVVSTKTGAIPELIPDGEVGILVAERNPSALARAMLKILQTPKLREKMGAAGRALAEERFDARKNVLIVEKVINSLLKMQ